MILDDTTALLMHWTCIIILIIILYLYSYNSRAECGNVTVHIVAHQHDVSLASNIPLESIQMNRF